MEKEKPPSLRLVPDAETRQHHEDLSAELARKTLELEGLETELADAYARSGVSDLIPTEEAVRQIYASHISRVEGLKREIPNLKAQLRQG